jgi:hypothetical protein
MNEETLRDKVKNEKLIQPGMEERVVVKSGDVVYTIHVPYRDIYSTGTLHPDILEAAITIGEKEIDVTDEIKTSIVEKLLSTASFALGTDTRVLEM